MQPIVPYRYASEIDDKVLEDNNILLVDSFNNLKENVSESEYNIGIIFDKSIIENSTEVDWINEWLKTQYEHQIIVIGYSNPTYVF